MIDFSNDTVRPLGQYSKKFSVTKATIHRWKKEEGFPAFMLVGAWYSSDKAVCEWMAKQQQDGESRRGNKHWNKNTFKENIKENKIKNRENTHQKTFKKQE